MSERTNRGKGPVVIITGVKQDSALLSRQHNSMLYPLRFDPIFRRYLWGGRRLATVLGKSIGVGDDFAESWEVVDHGLNQSIVCHGELKGRSLHQLLVEHSHELLGRYATLGRFPLLFKFLDCNRVLSVQVHPDDARASRADPPDLGKTEAWVVLHADPGSYIYAGLGPGVDRQELSQALARGRVAQCLHRIEPQAGDCLFIPAGLVHALGAGLVVAEIQQSSDTTYRLFDWNRKDAEGKERPLHREQAMKCIDFQLGPAILQQPVSIDTYGRERLVDCEKFVLDRVTTHNPLPIGGDDRFHLLAVLSGSASVDHDPSGMPLIKGQTMLLPAALGSTCVTPNQDCTLLDVYLP